METYKKLIVWEKSIQLVELVYKITGSYPDEEKFGLTSQIRRCAVSIPSDIAEGHDRRSTKEFAQFLSISMGSAFELESQLIVAQKLNYINEGDVDLLCKRITQIQNMLFKLKQSIKEKIYN